MTPLDSFRKHKEQLSMTVDRARVAAIVQIGLQTAGVRLDAVELGQLHSLTTVLIEGLDRLDELNMPADQVEPALIMVVPQPNDKVQPSKPAKRNDND
jgi:hypothetical protein